MGGGGLLCGSLARANRYCKTHCRILFWRIRAALKKALNNGNQRKRRFRFQYDPSSYALNFDDGGDWGFHHSNFKVHSFCYTTTSTWIYVFWVESSQIPC